MHHRRGQGPAVAAAVILSDAATASAGAVAVPADRLAAATAAAAAAWLSMQHLQLRLGQAALPCYQRCRLAGTTAEDLP